MHPRTETIQSGKVRNLDVTESLTFQGSPVVPGGGGGGSTVKVTINDTAAATLSSKLVGGSGVTTTVVNPGANEQLSVAVGSLPASAIATGTIDTARLGSGVANNTTFLRGDQTYAVPAYPVTSVNTKTGPVTLTNTDVGAAATVHTHDAADISTGTVATARLGSGTASSTTFLRGDQTYATPIDNKVKVTSNDTTTDFLNAKITAGTNVTFTVNNPGGNESISVSVPGAVPPLSLTASENLSAGDLVSIHGTGQVRKADASNSRRADGFVTANVNSGSTATVFPVGSITTLSGLTSGTTYYLSSTTAGAVTATAPTASGSIVQIIGFGSSSSVLFFLPQVPVILA